MISNRRSDANGKVLIKGVGENPLPATQAWGPRRTGPPVAAPGTGDSHIDLLCYLGPSQALVTKLHYQLRGGGMSGRTAATHGDAGTLELLADRAPVNAQLGTDLAQSPTLGIQVGCTLNVHRATVTTVVCRGPPRARFWTVDGRPDTPSPREPAVELDSPGRLIGGSFDRSVYVDGSD
jgi:hypothetical protein